jgi:hypothetical protein
VNYIIPTLTMSNDDIHMEELYISDTVDDEVVEEIHANLYQMRFERSDVTNVASAMDVDDEVSKGLTSFDGEENLNDKKDSKDEISES